MNDRKRTPLEEKWASAEELRASSASDAAEGEPRESRAAEVDGEDRSEAAPADREQELAREVEGLREQLLRKQAELVNFRRRTQREGQERRRAERVAVLRELLPAIDDFERATAAEVDDLDSYREGVELILRSMHDVLARLGVERLEPEGERFDPNLHEAVERQATDAVPEGHVSAVYKPGYVLDDRLVRAAMVAVATSAGEAEGGSDDDGDR